MRRLFYITRSYYPDKSGGAIVRQGAVKCLSEYFDVYVVTIGEQECFDAENKIYRFPYGYNPRVMFDF